MMEDNTRMAFCDILKINYEMAASILDGNGQRLMFEPDGKCFRLFIIRSDNTINIIHYDLKIAWDITTYIIGVEVVLEWENIVREFELNQVWYVEDPMKGMEIAKPMECENKTVIDKYIKENLLENEMYEQDIIELSKKVIKDTMVDFLFEPADMVTFARMEELIAYDLMALISTDFDINVREDDNDDIVVTLKLLTLGDEPVEIVARYFDCPVLPTGNFEGIEPSEQDNEVIAFNRAMEIL